MNNEIFRLIRDNNYGGLKALLDGEPDMVELEEDGDRPLHVAARCGQARMTDLLLTHGADVNARNGEGDTALHLACENYSRQDGEGALIRLLAAAPALEIQNRAGETPWDVAFGSDNEEVCFFLDEAEMLQEARQASIALILYTVVETDEGLEVHDLEAINRDGEPITLIGDEITRYTDYFINRRNWFGGLGEFDDNPAGGLAWVVQERKVYPYQRYDYDSTDCQDNSAARPQESASPDAHAVTADLTAGSLAEMFGQCAAGEYRALIDAIAARGQDAVVPLFSVLEDPSWRVAASAALALGRIGDQRTVGSLIGTLKQDARRFFVTEAAIWALGRVGNAACVAPILDILSNWEEAFDVDVVAVSAEALSHFPAETSLGLGEFIDKSLDYGASVQEAALAMLSRMPDEIAIAPLIRLLWSEYTFLQAEKALGRIGWPAAKPLVDLFFEPCDRFEPDQPAHALSNMGNPYVIDLVIRRVQSDGNEASYSAGEKALGSIVAISPQYGRCVAERLLPMALNPRDDAENDFIWNALDETVRHQPEPLREILQHVLDKIDDDDRDEVIAEAITSIATLSEVDGIPVPRPARVKTTQHSVASGEEWLLATLDGKNDILKSFENQDATAIAQSLFHRIEEEDDNYAEILPLIKALALVGPAAIEKLYELRVDEESRWGDGLVPGFASKGLKALNIVALGAKAVPPLLHALRLLEWGTDARTEIEEYLEAIGPAALSEIDAEIFRAEGYNATHSLSAGHIDLPTLFAIRDSIITHASS